MKEGIHALISGKVQGVWYRASTKKQADELEISGWVRNLPDGRVEVKAFGTSEKLSEFLSWLWKGPKGAKVQDIDNNKILWEEHKSFEVLATPKE